MNFDLGPPPAPPVAQPIADLTYRNFDGPLKTRALRWWIVTLASLRLVRKNVGFWVLAAICAMPAFVSGVTYYVASRTVGMGTDHNFTPEFVQAVGFQSLWLFGLGLLLGSGAIAADNRANALLVYLAKPITKADYLLGKWMGIVLLIFLAGCIPMLLLYVFCLIMFLNNGFLHHEPGLVLRIIGAAIVPAVVNASLLVGISAWSKTPRMAGALYAAAYFLSAAVAGIVWQIRYHGQPSGGALLRSLSIPGLIDGLVQRVYNATPAMRFAGRQEMAPLWPLLLIAAALCVLGILAARAKINAVEVVRG